MTVIISRAEWGAAPPRAVTHIPGALPDVIIHTFAGTSTGTLPMSFDRAAGIMRSVQRSHFNRGFDDFGYSYAVDPVGRVFEGRGWRVRGAHTQHGGNYTGHGIGHFGHGDHQPFTGAQWAATRQLILDGVTGGHIRPDYRITGHRDWLLAGEYKSCPGDLVYPHIHKLDPGTDFMTEGGDVNLEGVAGLKLGDTGDDVRELQVLLNTQGAGLVVDGQFGPATQNMLKNFLVNNRTVGMHDAIIADKPVMTLLRYYAGTLVTEGDTAVDVEIRRQVNGMVMHIPKLLDATEKALAEAQAFNGYTSELNRLTS